MEKNEFKACPFCKEQIRAEAIKCRYCGEWLEHPPQPSAIKQDVIETKSVGAPTELIPPAVTEPVDAPQTPEPDATPTPIPTVQRQRTWSNPKTINIISAALLTIGVVIWVVPLTLIPWNTLAPGKEEKLISGLTASFLKFFFCAALICWKIKPKHTKFLTFASLTFVFACVFAYYFNDARQSGLAENKQIKHRVSSNIVSAIDTATKGGVPSFASTGDEGIDKGIPVLNGLIKNLYGSVQKMNEDIEALQEQQAFSDSTLTNEAALKAEIEKRITSCAIVTNHHSEIQKIFGEFKKQATDIQNTSDKAVGEGMIQGLVQQSPLYDQMFALRFSAEAAERDFLQFMSDHFVEYQLTNHKISFSKNFDTDKYHQLAAAVKTTAQQLDEFQKQRLADAQAAKTKAAELYK